MEGVKILRNTQIIILGVCFAVATIVSTVIFSKGLLKIKKFSSEVIRVTGSAEKNIISDSILWQASFSRRAPQMVTAFNMLKEDFKVVKNYLIFKGIKEEEITVSPVKTEVLYKKNDQGNDTNEIEAYLLTQDIEVKSSEVNKVADVSRQATELIEKDIEFFSQAPEYFYTGLNSLKHEMLGLATEDAKKRAEEMVGFTGNKIGPMRSARMGVFQITPADSFEVSDWGVNDTTSLEKKLTAVVQAEFAILE